MIQKYDIVQYRYGKYLIGLVLNIFNSKSKENYLPTTTCARVLWADSKDIMFIDINKLIKIN